MTVMPVTDALLAVLPVPAGVTKDRSAAAPRGDPAANRLYCWPRPIAPHRLEEADGRWEEALLHVRLALTMFGENEEQGAQPDRDVSVALDNAVDAIVAAIAANRMHDLWYDLYVEGISYNAVRTFTVRGHVVDLVVRMDAPPALA